jgi:hypothetical protein
MRIQDTLIEQGRDRQEVFAIVDEVLANPPPSQRELDEQKAREPRPNYFEEGLERLAPSMRGIGGIVIFLLVAGLLVVDTFDLGLVPYILLLGVGFVILGAIALVGRSSTGTPK